MANIEELKTIVANNIATYRKAKGLTQAELAEKLNYSDKSISKWERGEGFPDIFTLKELADFFGIKVGDFFSEKPVTIKKRPPMKKEVIIPLLSVGIAWLTIAIAFAIIEIFFHQQVRGVWDSWLIFIYGVPVTGIILTIFFALYHSKTLVLIGESIIVWGVGLSIFLTAVMIKNLNGIWLVFIICGVLEILAILYYILKNDKISFRNWFKKKKKDDN